MSQSTPRRIHWRGGQGWPQAQNAIYVGRPTKWGNPYKIGPYTRQEAVRFYERDLVSGKLPFSVNDIVHELKGKDLICWCKPGHLCHADILITLANAAPDYRNSAH